MKIKYEYTKGEELADLMIKSECFDEINLIARKFERLSKDDQYFFLIKIGSRFSTINCGHGLGERDRVNLKPILDLLSDDKP